MQVPDIEQNVRRNDVPERQVRLQLAALSGGQALEALRPTGAPRVRYVRARRKSYYASKMLLNHALTVVEEVS
jgi:hypothetical protein